MRSFVSQQVEAQEVENRELEVALRSLRKETADVDVLHGFLRDCLARRQVARVLAEGSSPSAEAFAELSRLAADIALTRAETREMQLIVAGIARSDDAVRKMAEQLGKTRFILNPRIASDGPAPAHERFGAGARAFRLEADVRR